MIVTYFEVNTLIMSKLKIDGSIPSPATRKEVATQRTVSYYV